MKILLCVASMADIEPCIVKASGKFGASPKLDFLSSGKILHHEVDVLETGYGIFQTTYKITKVLSLQKYHLALKVSLGNAYKEEISVGTILNIVNEKPGDFGIGDGPNWKDLYERGLLNREDPPNQRGGFVNLNNSYMNVFMSYKKVVGVTVNNYADKNTFLAREEKYKADCETMDGLGFTYTCLYEKQNFYNLCSIERNLVTGEENLSAAKESLQRSLEDIIAKL